MRYAPTPVRASCTQLSWLASLTPPASAEAGKLAGYLKSPYQANLAGVRPLPRQGSWPGTSKARTKQTSPASADAPRARKAPKRAAERFRGLGKLQNTPLKVSEGSEGSKHAAEGFRGVGRDASQAGRGHQGCLPRKPGTSNAYPDRFAGVRRRPPASADAPRGESEARAGATATARAAAPRSTAIAVAVAAAPQIVTAVR